MATDLPLRSESVQISDRFDAKLYKKAEKLQWSFRHTFSYLFRSNQAKVASNQRPP